MTRLSVEDSITQTTNTAQALLFDREGKPKGIDHYLAALTLHTLSDQPSGSDKQIKPDIHVFKWRGDIWFMIPASPNILAMFGSSTATGYYAMRPP